MLIVYKLCSSSQNGMSTRRPSRTYIDVIIQIGCPSQPITWQKAHFSRKKLCIFSAYQASADARDVLTYCVQRVPGKAARRQLRLTCTKQRA